MVFSYLTILFTQTTWISLFIFLFSLTFLKILISIVRKWNVNGSGMEFFCLEIKIEKQSKSSFHFSQWHDNYPFLVYTTQQCLSKKKSFNVAYNNWGELGVLIIWIISRWVLIQYVSIEWQNNKHTQIHTKNSNGKEKLCKYILFVMSTIQRNR